MCIVATKVKYFQTELKSQLVNHKIKKKKKIAAVM